MTQTIGENQIQGLDAQYNDAFDVWSRGQRVDFNEDVIMSGTFLRSDLDLNETYHWYVP
jgi:hypothetical protein